MEIRIMRPEEQSELAEFAKGFNKFVRDMPAIWSRWKLWETQPPLVAIVDGKIVGFAAANFLKNDYMNHLYTGISPAMEGTGIGKQLIWANIQRAQALGLTRFTGKTDLVLGGKNFLMALGMIPMVYTATECIFDCEFGDSVTLEEFRARLASGVANTPATERKLKLFAKNGYTLLY